MPCRTTRMAKLVTGFESTGTLEASNKIKINTRRWWHLYLPLKHGVVGLKMRESEIFCKLQSLIWCLMLQSNNDIWTHIDFSETSLLNVIELLQIGLCVFQITFLIKYLWISSSLQHLEVFYWHWSYIRENHAKLTEKNIQYNRNKTE